VATAKIAMLVLIIVLQEPSLPLENISAYEARVLGYIVHDPESKPQRRDG